MYTRWYSCLLFIFFCSYAIIRMISIFLCFSSLTLLCVCVCTLHHSRHTSSVYYQSDLLLSSLRYYRYFPFLTATSVYSPRSCYSSLSLYAFGTCEIVDHTSHHDDRYSVHSSLECALPQPGSSAWWLILLEVYRRRHSCLWNDAHGYMSSRCRQVQHAGEPRDAQVSRSEP